MSPWATSVTVRDVVAADLRRRDLREVRRAEAVDRPDREVHPAVSLADRRVLHHVVELKPRVGVIRLRRVLLGVAEGVGRERVQVDEDVPARLRRDRAGSTWSMPFAAVVSPLMRSFGAGMSIVVLLAGSIAKSTECPEAPRSRPRAGAAGGGLRGGVARSCTQRERRRQKPAHGRCPFDHPNHPTHERAPLFDHTPGRYAIMPPSFAGGALRPTSHGGQRCAGTPAMPERPASTLGDALVSARSCPCRATRPSARASAPPAIRALYVRRRPPRLGLRAHLRRPRRRALARGAEEGRPVVPRRRRSLRRVHLPAASSAACSTSASTPPSAT